MIPGFAPALTVKTYAFFDQSLEAALPTEVQEQLNLLYGRFVVRAPDRTPSFRVTWESLVGARGLLRSATGGREMARHQLLLHLQDLIQNQLLPGVRSCLLWHGAAWCVNGGGIMILGESGLGKTTLALAEHGSGGRVLSDEIAAWDPARARLLPFPRAMAVRPDSLRLLGISETWPHLFLDEDKAIVPLAPEAAHESEAGLPLRAAVFLAWPTDEACSEPGFTCELCVAAPNDAWRRGLQEQNPGLRLAPHPDGRGWWRCHSEAPLRVDRLEQAVQQGQGRIAGFHRGAHRFPSFTGEPVLEAWGAAQAAERSLSDLINGRALAGLLTAPRLMALVRAALHGIRCVRCVPGSLRETRRALQGLV